MPDELSTITFASFNAVIPIGEARRLREAAKPMSSLDPMYETYVAPRLTSSDETVASIVNNGFVMALSPGTAVITASGSAGSHGSVTVTVVPAVYDDFDRMRRKYRDSMIPWEIDLSDPVIAGIIQNADSLAQTDFNTMRKTFIDGSAESQLWELPSQNATQNFEASSLFAGLENMARAFIMPGRFHFDPEIFDAVVMGMRFNLNNMFRGNIKHSDARAVLDQYYPEGHPQRARIDSQAPIYSLNWWHHDIGYSAASIKVLTLLYEAGFPEDLLQDYAKRIHIYTPNPAARVFNGYTNSGGANQAEKSFFALMDGILRKDENRVRFAAGTVFTGDQVLFQNGILGGQNDNGFYWDGSVRDHTYFASALSYGLVNLDTAAKIICVAGGESINGIPIVFNEENNNRLMSILDQTYLTAGWRGAGMPSLMGRSTSRESHTSGDEGLAAAMARLLPGFPAGVQPVIREHIKSWVENNPKLMQSGNIYHNAEIREIYENTDTAREGTGIYAQNHQSRVFYRGGDFVFAVAVNNYNANTGPHTSLNGENIKGVFAGEGMTYLHLDNDHFQYGGNYFATADSFHFPGTTVEIREDFSWSSGEYGANTKPNSRQDLGGTAALRPELGGMQPHVGTVGSTAFKQDFSGSSPEGMDMNVTANKSWFMLDGRIIAMGTNIASDKNREVITAIDQRRLPAGTLESFVFNGTDTGTFHSVVTTENSWAHLRYKGSTGNISQVGWFIPTGGQNLSIGTRSLSGRWSEINLDNSTVLHTDVYANIFVSHGINPVRGSYEYVIFPNAAKEDIEAFASAQMSSSPVYKTVCFTDTLHAVYDYHGSVLMLNNFAEESASVTSPVSAIVYTVSAAANIIIREEKQPDGIYRLNVAILDPTGANPVIKVGLPGVSGSVLQADENVSIASNGSGTVITADRLTDFQNRRFNSWGAILTAKVLEG